MVARRKSSVNLNFGFRGGSGAPPPDLKGKRVPAAFSYNPGIHFGGGEKNLDTKTGPTLRYD